MPKETNHSPFVTVKEAARRLGLSEDTIRTMIKKKQLTYYRFGSSIRIDPVDLTAFKTASRVSAVRPRESALGDEPCQAIPTKR